MSWFKLEIARTIIKHKSIVVSNSILVIESAKLSPIYIHAMVQNPFATYNLLKLNATAYYFSFSVESTPK